jgi:imidazolonepropionase-like amidohydrolase
MKWCCPLILAVSLTASGCMWGADHFISSTAPVAALVHVGVIDGSGAPGRDDQVIVIRHGRIAAIGRFGSIPVPSEARVIDLAGRTAIPGLIGMHDHLFYEVDQQESGSLIVAPRSTFAKLYLASGVTTIRTAGAVDLAGDLRIKHRIDGGKEPGPRIHVTGPYLNAVSAEPNPQEIARQVIEAAKEGATSVKAYTTLRSAELRAAVDAAHQLGLQVTGHLCAVGFREAVALGIDNLEHGLFADTDFYSEKQADQCPSQSKVLGELLTLDLRGPGVRSTIAEIVRHNVAITSTLAVLESFTGRTGALDPRVSDILSSGMRSIYQAARANWSDPNAERPRAWMGILVKEMEFERAFVAAGGRLLAGVDPTGWGGVVAGFGDQRELELLVDAGFTPEAAIKIATSNGAAFLRESDVGTLAAGTRADLVVVRGNPSSRISDVRNVEIVFKDGIGYDPTALIRATNGTVSRYDVGRLVLWPWNALIGSLLVCLVCRMVWRRSRFVRRLFARGAST